MRLTLLLTLSVTLVGICAAKSPVQFGPNLPRNRAKRFAASGCRMNPDNDEESVIDEGESVTLECGFDAEVVSCIWTHTEPINEGKVSDPEIVCSAGSDSSGESCQDESRVTYQVSDSKCGITISNTEPEDSGYWKLDGVGLTSSNSATAGYDFLVYTYNQSTNYMYDEDDNDITNGNFETSYNYNDRQKKWEPEKSNWETVEFTAKGFGGRPEPVFKWYIENNDNDDLNERDEFHISEGKLGCEDSRSMICNFQSTIEFTIDDTLMEYLEEIGVDVNPKDELVRFELNCEIEQGTNSYVERVSVELRVEKSYDNGNLPADTIGIIVGCILGVLILVLIIALLVFAKANRRWCFADDEYGYNDPKDPRSKPRSSSSGHHQSRSHRGHSSSHQQVQSAAIINKSAKAENSSSSSPSVKKTKFSTTSASSSSAQSSILKNKPPAPAPVITTHNNLHQTDGNQFNLSEAYPKPMVSLTTSSNSSSSTRSNNDTPPLRPYKQEELQYANLQHNRTWSVKQQEMTFSHRSWTHDPRNQVLPQETVVPRQSPTQYATIVPGGSKVV